MDSSPAIGGAPASAPAESATPLPRTEVVHVKDGCDVYIGREMPGYPRSDFANDYRVGPDGTLDEVIAKYEKKLLERLAADPVLRAKLQTLKGKKVGCWCKRKGRPAHLQKRCHGDVLVRLLEGEEPAPPAPPAQLDLF